MASVLLQVRSRDPFSNSGPYLEEGEGEVPLQFCWPFKNNNEPMNYHEREGYWCLFTVRTNSLDSTVEEESLIHKTLWYVECAFFLLQVMDWIILFLIFVANVAWSCKLLFLSKLWLCYCYTSVIECRNWSA